MFNERDLYLQSPRSPERKIKFAASALIYRHDQYGNREYLFVRELRGGKLLLNQPTGRIQMETAEQAAIRETLEETGYTITIESKLGEYLQQFTFDDWHRTCFVAKVDQSVERKEVSDSDVQDCVWLSFEEIVNGHLNETVLLRNQATLKCILDYETSLVRES